MLRISELGSFGRSICRGLPRTMFSLIALCVLLAGMSASAPALTTQPHLSTPAQSAKKHHRTESHRSRGVHCRGGKVQRVWPHGGRPPKSALARWLAKQVGPGRTLPCSKRPASARRASTIQGNSLTATIDGTQVLNVPNLTVASATAAASSYGLTAPIAAPLSGSYGLRAWGSAVVHFQRVTAGPVV
jgi:hypothetical protein